MVSTEVPSANGLHANRKRKATGGRHVLEWKGETARTMDTCILVSLQTSNHSQTDTSRPAKLVVATLAWLANR
jgi:hypothetical protein